MTTQTTADILRKAKAHISDPAMWNQDGHYFKTGHSFMLRHIDTSDFDFYTCPACAFGAIQVASQANAHALADKILEEALYDVVGTRDVVSYNDDRRTTHSDIMALFDCAIELADQ